MQKSAPLISAAELHQKLSRRKVLGKPLLIHAREWDEPATPGTDAHTFCPRHPQVKLEKTCVGGRATYTCPVCQPAPAG